MGAYRINMNIDLDCLVFSRKTRELGTVPRYPGCFLRGWSRFTCIKITACRSRNSRIGRSTPPIEDRPRAPVCGAKVCVAVTSTAEPCTLLKLPWVQSKPDAVPPTWPSYNPAVAVGSKKFRLREG